MKFTVIAFLATALIASASPFPLPTDIAPMAPTETVAGDPKEAANGVATDTASVATTAAAPTDPKEAAPAETTTFAPMDPTEAAPVEKATAAAPVDPTEAAPGEPTTTEVAPPAYPTYSARAILPVAKVNSKDIRAGYMAVPTDLINARAESVTSSRSQHPTTTKATKTTFTTSSVTTKQADGTKATTTAATSTKQVPPSTTFETRTASTVQ